MTEKTLQKLEFAFAGGASDTMACIIADIAPATLYNYQNDNPGFVERKKELKEMTRYQARANVSRAVSKGDPDMTKYFLDRRDKDFKPKQDHTTNDKDLPTPILGGSTKQDVPANPDAA